MTPKSCGRDVAWLPTLLLPALVACSQSLQAQDMGAQDAGTQDGETTVELCNGSSDIRLAFRVGGGGPAAAGQSMLAENGWQFLLVDGTCVAWVLEDSNNRLIRTVLSSDDEAKLAVALQLSDWNRITPATGGCPDAPGYSFRFGDQRLSGGDPCGVSGRNVWTELIAAAAEQLHHLAAAGEPWAGDLRYLAIQEETRNDSRPAVGWPLTTSLETIALSPEQAFSYRPGGSRRATGDDASKLRAIRTTAASAMSSYGVSYDFTRLAGEDGKTYQLYVRDALPFEGDDGLVPPGVF